MSGKNDIIFRYIRNLDDDSMMKFLDKVYNYGYVDGYNGNDSEQEFKELLDEIYKEAIK